MTLRVDTMNIGRSGISKIPAVHDAILGLDVVFCKRSTSIVLVWLVLYSNGSVWIFIFYVAE